MDKWGPLGEESGLWPEREERCSHGNTLSLEHVKPKGRGGAGRTAGAMAGDHEAGPAARGAHRGWQDRLGTGPVTEPGTIWRFLDEAQTVPWPCFASAAPQPSPGARAGMQGPVQNRPEPCPAPRGPREGEGHYQRGGWLLPGRRSGWARELRTPRDETPEQMGLESSLSPSRQIPRDMRPEDLAQAPSPLLHLPGPLHSPSWAGGESPGRGGGVVLSHIPIPMATPRALACWGHGQSPLQAGGGGRR